MGAGCPAAALPPGSASWRRAAVALLCALASLPAPARAAQGPRCAETLVQRARPMMATVVSISVRGCDVAALEAGIAAGFAEMERLAGILSEWDPTSAVSRVNAQAGEQPAPAPRELLDVLQAAQAAARATSGAFDPTWAALSDLWKFDGTQAAPPAAEEVRRRLRLVDFRALTLDAAAGTAFLRERGMRLGLGGLAKGYIAAAAADLLVGRGIGSCLVAASGDIAARGRNGGRPWTVAVRDPRRRGATLATVELRDESISTAGDSERFFVAGGRRYHHILDPRTGYPARGTRSVTVVARSGVWADALDTGLLVLGSRRGLPVVEAMPGVAALFVDGAGAIHLSRGAASRFKLRSAPRGR